MSSRPRPQKRAKHNAKAKLKTTLNPNKTTASRKYDFQYEGAEGRIHAYEYGDTVVPVRRVVSPGILKPDACKALVLSREDTSALRRILIRS